jgi:hypothetical protein
MSPRRPWRHRFVGDREGCTRSDEQLRRAYIQLT